MTKDQFLSDLNRLLSGIPEHERKDILNDYQEHFQMGLQNGKTEEEIADSLGTPKTIAKELAADFHISQAQENYSVSNILRATIATVSLGFFNLVFVFGPFMGLIGVMIGFYAVTLSLLLSPIFIIIGSVFPFAVNDFLQGLFLMMTLGSLGVLMGVGMIYVTKGVYYILLKYLQFNLRIIRGRSE